MNLSEAFNEYNLKSGQKDLIRKLQLFFENDEHTFLMKGYAGTGKTFMLQGLVKFFIECNHSFAIAAPTGRAARVAAKRTKAKTSTIHRLIYSNTDVQEYKTEDVDGSETFKFFYNLKNNEASADTVYLIDEASMISNQYSEGEFFRFGSGYLLNDLVEYINPKQAGLRRKIIIIGDNAQLPPVNMNFSPALDEEYLQSTCGLTLSSHELTEVVRQDENSGILKNATNLRNALKAKTFFNLAINTKHIDVQDMQPADMLDIYMKTCNRQIDDETTIIAYSNAMVKEYNDLVRSQFFPDELNVTCDDKLLIIQNNYNYGVELMNGDYARVIETDLQITIRKVTLKAKQKDGKIFEKNIDLLFREAKIKVTDTNNIEYSIACQLLENVLYSAQPNISPDEQKALYIDFWIRNSKLNQIKQLLHAKNIDFWKLKELINGLGLADVTEAMLAKIKAFEKEYFQKPDTQSLRKISIFILKDALRADPFFNAVRVKFGYAITCHKAQGGEWKNVFVNCQTHMGYFNPMYFRWLYTAITRAKEMLFVLNAPNDRTGLLSVINFTFQDQVIILKKEVWEMDIPIPLPDNIPFLQIIYYAIFDLLKDEGLTIDSIQHHQYHEAYFLSKGTEKANFKIYYNNKDKISNIQKDNNTFLWIQPIFEKLQTLQNKYIIREEDDLLSEAIEKEFHFPEQFLEDFHKLIYTKLTGSGIRISDISSANFLQKYFFCQNGHTAVIDFWYNGKQQFRNTRIDEQKTTSAALANTILENLK